MNMVDLGLRKNGEFCSHGGMTSRQTRALGLSNYLSFSSSPLLSVLG